MTTHELARQLLEQPDEPVRGRGVEQLWIDMVTATRTAALKEVELLRRELDKVKKA